MTKQPDPAFAARETMQFHHSVLSETLTSTGTWDARDLIGFDGARVGLVEMDDDAQSLWETALYAQIEDQTYPELIGSLLGRRSLHTMIFAALLALLDRHKKIGADHLLAANAWMAQLEGAGRS